MTDTAELYDTDFYAWTRQQARALRELAATHPNAPLDLPHLIEEVADLGKSERDAVYSQMTRVIHHLLKLEYAPASMPRGGWRTSIIEARTSLQRKLTPTLQRKAGRQLSELYTDAKALTVADLEDHGEMEAVRGLPTTCPYTLAQALDRDWLPK